jgi:hypothetical protein
MQAWVVSHARFDKAVNLFRVNCMLTCLLAFHAWFVRIGEIYSPLFVIPLRPTKIQL